MTAHRAPAQPRMYPAASRAAADCELAATLRDTLAAEHVSHDAVAAALGVSRQRVDRYCDPHAPDNTPRLRASELRSLAEVAPEAVRRLLAPVLDRLGLGLVALPDAMPASSAKAAAQFARESGDVVATELEAREDGSVSPVEAVRIERECNEALSALLTVRECARAAQRAGAVVAIRRRA